MQWQKNCHIIKGVVGQFHDFYHVGYQTLYRISLSSYMYQQDTKLTLMLCCFLHAGDMHADFSGYGSGDGPGAGLSRREGCGEYDACAGGSGGGHGGRGGRSFKAYHSGYSYGSLYSPQSKGSGGGDGWSKKGGRGGGTVYIMYIPVVNIV